jgi:hypothetical protein
MADRVSYAHATTCSAITRAEKFFHIAAKPLAAVLLNQLRARCSPTWRCGTGPWGGLHTVPSEELSGHMKLTQIGWAPERQFINPNEDYELRYWSERFDVPTDEIVAAVKRVGTRVEDVARELNRHEYSDATLVPI